MADARHDDTDHQAIKAAKDTLVTCNTRLDRYRAALDSGTALPSSADGSPTSKPRESPPRQICVASPDAGP
ncbi:hypothetical protein [Micromonospora sp. NPDC023956]|uniref:hypothetical protein n=1 Tax=Micromonospora sp. NPDC023956 TaxID=3155722 RepID=UPI0033BFFF51